MLFENFIFRNFSFVVIFIKKGLLKASEKYLKYALNPQKSGNLQNKIDILCTHMWHGKYLHTPTF